MSRDNMKMEMDQSTHLCDPITERVDDATDHHLGQNRVGLECLLICRPVVLGHVPKDLKDRPPLHKIPSIRPPKQGLVVLNPNLIENQLIKARTRGSKTKRRTCQ